MAPKLFKRICEKIQHRREERAEKYLYLHSANCLDCIASHFCSTAEHLEQAAHGSRRWHDGLCANATATREDNKLRISHPLHQTPSMQQHVSILEPHPSANRTSTQRRAQSIRQWDRGYQTTLSTSTSTWSRWQDRLRAGQYHQRSFIRGSTIRLVRAPEPPAGSGFIAWVAYELENLGLPQGKSDVVGKDYKDERQLETVPKLIRISL
jgi:hypothetical protein